MSRALQPEQGEEGGRERDTPQHGRPEPDVEAALPPCPLPLASPALIPHVGGGEPAPSSATDFSGCCHRLFLFGSGSGHPAWVITTHCSLGRIPS